MIRFLLILSSFIFISNCWSNVQDDINKLFEDMNVYSSTTDPKVVDGQRQGYITLGSIKAKTMYKKINLFTVQAPYVKSGCGGIDIFMGGFSFVNKDELKQMLQAIAQNAAGYMFQIAFESMCPTCNAIMKDLADMANDARNFLGDSCNTAKYLVDYSKDSVNSQNSEYCMSYNLKSGADDDTVALRDKCYANNSNAMSNYITDIKATFASIYDSLGTNDQNSISVSGDNAAKLTDAKSIVRPGNLIYDKILEAFPGISNKDIRNTILSTIGFPYAVYNNNSFENIEYQPPTLTYHGLIYGKEKEEKIEIIICKDTLCFPDSGNSHIQYQDITNSYIPFKDKIESSLLKIYDKIRGIDTTEMSHAENSIIGGISALPVYKNLQDIALIKNDSLAHSYIKRVSVVVANEIAYSYFLNIRKVINEIKSKINLPPQIVSKFEDNLQVIYDSQDNIYDLEKDKLKDFDLAFQITKSIQGSIKELMPNQLKIIK